MAESKPEFPENVNTIIADDGTTWVEIASTGTEDEAALLAGFLDAEGIPAQVEDVKFNMAPTDFGTMGDIRVYVPSEHEQRAQELLRQREQDRKSTRLNSSHSQISYAVFCLKKNKNS